MCNKCKQYKTYDEFVKNKSFPDGIWCYCKNCHKQWRPRKLPIMKKTRTHKQCRMCGEMKLFDEYANGKYSHTYCYQCRRKKGLEANLERHGLSPEQYIELEQKQNGLCAICKKPEPTKKRLAVDHDHSCCPGLKTCGKCIRGLLCSRCNRGIGLFYDNPILLQSAKDYLIL